MKITIKSLLALFLCFCLLPQVSIGNASGLSNTDSDPRILNPESLSALFDRTINTQSLASSTNSGTSFSVEYNFECEAGANANSPKKVQLDFTLSNGTFKIPFALDGEIAPYQLSHNVLWEGMLRGEVSIGGVPYLVLASFSMLNANTDAQISVTIQSYDGNSDFDPVYFTFGDQVLTDSIINEISSMASAANVTEALPLSPSMRNIPSDAYTYLPGSFSSPIFPSSYFVDENNIRARSHISKAYYQPDKNIIAIALCTNSEPVERFFSSSYYLVRTSVSHIRFDFTVLENDADSHASISLPLSTSFGSRDIDNESAFIWNLFGALMSDLGFSTSTISELLGSMASGYIGTINRETFADTAYVDVSFGLLDNCVFDTNEPCVGVAYQLVTTNIYEGDTRFNYQISLVYRTAVQQLFQTDPSYFYTHTTATNVNFTFDLV